MRACIPNRTLNELLLDREIENVRASIGLDPLRWLVWTALLGLSLIGITYLSDTIVQQDYRGLTIYCAFGVALFVAVFVLKNWRIGMLAFFAWIGFEDLFRKYLGNELILYAVKDLLIGITYFSYFVSVWKNREEKLRNPLRVPLLLWFLWAVVEMFNPAAYNWKVALLGLRLSFLYIPLLYLGYAFFRSERELRKFLGLIMAIGFLIGGLGLAQSVLGLSFLNPSSAPHLRLDLVRYSVEGLVVPRPNSTFVDAGRFAQYLFLMFVIGLGVFCYLYSPGKDRPSGRLKLGAWVFFILISVVLFISGQRIAIVSVGLLFPIFLLGSLWRKQGVRAPFPLARIVVTAGVGLLLLAMWMPARLESVYSFYGETLDPAGPYSELTQRRAGQWAEFARVAADTPLLGHGTGTCSLGLQYILDSKNLPENFSGAEGGYAAVVWEWGFPGLALWLLWTVMLGRELLRKLKEITAPGLFWLGLSFTVFILLILFPWFFLGMQVYQNYVTNAFLWFLAGAVFKLPELGES